MAYASDSRQKPDGAQLYRMFQDGTLVSTDTTHKAFLDELYNNMMTNPDMLTFQTYYSSYLTTNHPYQMHLSYVGPA